MSDPIQPIVKVVRKVDLKKPIVHRKRISIWFAATGLISLGIWLKANWHPSTAWMAPQTLSYTVERAGVKIEKDRSGESQSVIGQIKETLKGRSGRYGVLVYRIEDGVSYGINENETMTAASMMKVPIFMAAEKAVAEGKMKLDDTYILAQEDIRSGSGPLEFSPPGTQLKTADLMEEMIRKSDNTATAALARMLGKEEIKQVIGELGMENTSFENNTTTTWDMAVMWMKVYKGEETAAEGRDVILSHFIDSIYEDRISLGLPEGVKFYHKVATGDGVWGDGGIIEDPSGKVKPFVLIILNKDVNSDEAKEVVPEIARIVWKRESGI
jgi:beta-lactamase class A